MEVLGLDRAHFKFCLMIFCVTLIMFSGCSGGEGKIRGVLQISTLNETSVPFSSWETFESNSNDICAVNEINQLNPIALKKGARVEVIKEAACTQVVFNTQTGESSKFSTGLSKVRFPSPTNVGNAADDAHGEKLDGVGPFWELWVFTSNVRIVEEKLRTQARYNVQNEEKVKQRLEQREKEKQEQKAKENAKK